MLCRRLAEREPLELGLRDLRLGRPAALGAFEINAQNAENAGPAVPALEEYVARLIRRDVIWQPRAILSGSLKNVAAFNVEL